MVNNIEPDMRQINQISGSFAQNIEKSADIGYFPDIQYIPSNKGI